MLTHAHAKCHNVVHKPDSRRREIVFFVFFLTLATFRPADTAAGDNAKEHNLLCRLTQMAGRQLAIPELDTSASAVASTLNELNASTSEPDWLSMFKLDDTGETKTEFPTDGAAKANEADWKNKWPAWAKAVAATRKHQKNPPIPNPYPPITNNEQKHALHTIAEQLSAVAGNLAERALRLKNKVQETDKAEAQAAIRTAVFGQATEVADVTADKVLGATDNRAAACDKAAVGKSILGDFYCLCTSSSNGADECGSGYTATDGRTKITFDSRDAQALLDTCTKDDDRQLTANEIAATIAEFSAALSRTNDKDGKKVTLGKTAAHTCTGEAGEICVTYSEHFGKKAKKGIEEIPWVKRLREAEKKLQAMERSATQHAALTTQLLAMQQQMDVAYTAAFQNRLRTIRKGAESSKADHQESHTTHENQNKCKAAINKTAAGCAAIDCDYDSEKNECKPKAGTDNIAAGTGEGAAGATTDKCKDKKKDDCKSPDCKWEGETCKDSSILVSKQFALTVVSAAFVALLF